MLIIGIKKKLYKEFNNKNLGEYHELYIQSDTLLVADVFENFRNKYIDTYNLNPAHFMSIENRNEIKIVNPYWYVVNGRKRN